MTFLPLGTADRLRKAAVCNWPALPLSLSPHIAAGTCLLSPPKTHCTAHLAQSAVADTWLSGRQENPIIQREPSSVWGCFCFCRSS